MAKSLRSKKKKRLRTLRREIAKPFYDKKEEAKLAAQEAAMAAPKLPPPSAPSSSSNMDVDMIESKPADNVAGLSLKPTGGVKKKMKKIVKLKKDLRKKKNKKSKHRF